MAHSLVAVVVLIGLHSVSACLPNNKRDPRLPNIQSASLDIPIHLDIQKGPVPSASMSVGVDSRFNQDLGNGNYRQFQQIGGFDVQAAAVPTINSQGKVIGMTGDVNVNLEQEHKMNFVQGNPMEQQRPHQIGQAVPSGSVVQQQQQPAVPQSVMDNLAQAPIIFFAPTDKPRITEALGLRAEYIIAISIVGAVVSLALLVIIILMIIRLKSRTAAQVRQR